MTVTFPALSCSLIRAHKEVEQARVSTEEAREQQLAVEIRTRVLRAEKQRWTELFALPPKRQRRWTLHGWVNGRHAHGMNRVSQT